LKKGLALANSELLYRRYSGTVENLHLVGTSTIRDADFFRRHDTCEGEEIRLLYTGRIQIEKGLRELVTAMSLLKDSPRRHSLHIVGWEDAAHRPIETQLTHLANSLGVKPQVVFHGRRSVGAELNAFYRMADFFVTPSYHEGFPRTIWEAMANSLPVIASKVGSIPLMLEHKRDAMLIAPRSAEEIARAVRDLESDPDARMRMISNGLRLASGRTVERQSERIVSLISQHLKRAPRPQTLAV
jgi:glycosyltransferase involved in cell wall biosynthesis